MSMRVLRAIGVIGAIAVAPVAAFGIWLLATPDYDGGRQAVGTMIVVGTGVAAAAYAGVFVLLRWRLRRRLGAADAIDT